MYEKKEKYRTSKNRGFHVRLLNRVEFFHDPCLRLFISCRKSFILDKIVTRVSVHGIEITIVEKFSVLQIMRQCRSNDSIHATSKILPESRINLRRPQRFNFSVESDATSDRVHHKIIYSIYI